VEVADHGVVGVFRVVRAASVIAQIKQQRVHIARSCGWDTHARTQHDEGNVRRVGKW
jgi:hypothetical protein